MQVHKNHVFRNPEGKENNFVKYLGKQNIEDLSAIKEQGKSAGKKEGLTVNRKVLIREAEACFNPECAFVSCGWGSNLQKDLAQVLYVEKIKNITLVKHLGEKKTPVCKLFQKTKYNTFLLIYYAFYFYPERWYK